jgi:diacylglycerol kinase (ATP)
MPKPSGLRRWLLAFKNSWAGFVVAYRGEAAVRQELWAIALLTPVAIWLPVATVERLILICSAVLVLVVELLNTAIEATVDRISLERHPLAGQAKDLGSAAVLTSLAIAMLCWAVLAGPPLWQWLRALLLG